MNNTKNSKDTAINIRTSEEIKKQFNEMIMGGATQTEKFEYLMSLYNESLGRQARLNIEDELKTIEVKFSEMTNVIENIKIKSNEWQNGIVDCYVKGLGEEFNILKEEIEFDENAKSMVKDLEKEKEKILGKLSEERDRLAQACNRVKELEEENKELVKSEAKAIKELATIQAQSIEDSTELISIKAILKEKEVQLESANRELSEAREFKYRAEQLEKELETIKHSKDTKNQAKDKEIEKLKNKIKELEAAAKVEPKTTKTNTKTNSNK